MHLNRNKLIDSKQLIINAYNNGSTLRDLAVVYECSVGTIRNLLLKEKIVLRPKGARIKPNGRKKIADELNNTLQV